MLLLRYLNGERVNLIQQEFKEEWKGRIVSNNKNEVSKVSIRILENVSRIKVFQVHDQSVTIHL